MTKRTKPIKKVKKAKKTKKDIVKLLSETLDLSQDQSRKAVQLVLDAIFDSIVETGRMELRNFGVFAVRCRKPRRARNPHTGEPVEVLEKHVVSFQPSKHLEDQVRKHGKKSIKVKESPAIIPLDSTDGDEENPTTNRLNGHAKSQLPNKPR